ncbi:hypothetical protein EPO15_16405 [bacterium]|nr:MAG: hypothetical protein EPO15_16405 [bacterium]
MKRTAIWVCSVLSAAAPASAQVITSRYAPVGSLGATSIAGVGALRPVIGALPRLSLSSPLPAASPLPSAVPTPAAAAPSVQAAQVPAAQKAPDPAGLRKDELAALFASAKGNVPAREDLAKTHLGFYIKDKDSEKYPAILVGEMQAPPGAAYEVLRAQPFQFDVSYLGGLLQETIDLAAQSLRAKDFAALSPVEFDAEGAHWFLKKGGFTVRFEVRRYYDHLILQMRTSGKDPSQPETVSYLYFFQDMPRRP